MKRKATKKTPPKPRTKAGKVRKVRAPRGGKDWRKAFLKHLEATGIYAAAARKAGVSLSTLHAHRVDEPDFERQCGEAMQACVDKAEVELRRRAIDGCKKPIYYAGKVVGHVLEFSDALLMAYLKAKRRREFGDKSEISGPGGGPIPTQPQKGEPDYGPDQFAHSFEQFSRGAGLGLPAPDGDRKPLDPQDPPRS